MKKKLLKSLFIVLFLTAAAGIVRGVTKAADAVYNDPVRFYNEHASEGEGYYENGYVYFGSRGKTATSGVKFKTVGYRIYLGDPAKPGFDKEKQPQMEVVLNGGWISEHKTTVADDGYTYVVRKARASRLRTLFATNVSDVTPKNLYKSKEDDYTIWNFDAIMTVVKNGNELCGKVTQDYDRGVITAEHNSHLYRYLDDCSYGKGIRDAENWNSDAKESLKSFFNQSVKVKPHPELNAEPANIYSEDDNIYFVMGNIWVRQSTDERPSDFKLSMRSYMVDDAVVDGKYEPNFNLFNIKARGVGQQNISGAKKSRGSMESGQSVFGLIDRKNAQTDYPSLGLVYHNTELTLRNNLADCQQADIWTYAYAYYKNDYPQAIPDDMTDKDKIESLLLTDSMVDEAASSGKLTISSDGTAPSIYVPAVTSMIGENMELSIPVHVNDGDGKAGIESIEAYRVNKSTGERESLKYFSYPEYTTQVVTTGYTDTVTDNMYGITDRSTDITIKGNTGYTYYIRATDNVGNVSESAFNFSKPVNYSIETGLSGGFTWPAGNRTYNPDMMYAAVSGGTGEIMSLSIFSDAEDNSSGERLVLANLSTQGGSLAHGLYSYNHTLNPMQYLKGKGYPDGSYLFDIVSGGAFSGAWGQIEVWKDETAPSVIGYGPFTDDIDKWINVKPTDPDSGINWDNYVSVTDSASGVNSVNMFATDNITANNPYGYLMNPVTEHNVPLYYAGKPTGVTGTVRQFISFENVPGYSEGKSITDEGRHTFNVSAKDNCGNTENAALYANFDYTPPEIVFPENLKKMGASTYYTNQAALQSCRFKATDYLSGLLRDGGSIKAYSVNGENRTELPVIVSEIKSEYSHSTEMYFSIVKYPDGTRQMTITIEVTDRAGNLTTKTFNIVSDYVAPKIFLSGGSRYFEYLTGNTIFRNDNISYIHDGKKVATDTLGLSMDWSDKEFEYWYSQKSWYAFMQGKDDFAELKYCYVKSKETGKTKSLTNEIVGDITKNPRWMYLYYPETGEYYHDNYDLTILCGREDGDHEMVLYAEDYAGNTVSYDFHVKLDNAGPEITYSSDKGTSANGWNPSFPGKVTINDKHSGIKKYSVYGSYEKGTTGQLLFSSDNIKAHKETAVMPAGLTEFLDVYVIATDYAGNSSEYHILEHTDMSAPEIRIEPHDEVPVNYTDNAGKTSDMLANTSSIDFIFSDEGSGIAYCVAGVWSADGENKELYKVTKHVGDVYNSIGSPVAAPGTETVINIDTSDWDRASVEFRAMCFDVAGNTINEFKTVLYARTAPRLSYTLNDTTGEGIWNPASVTIQAESDFLGLQKLDVDPTFPQENYSFYYTPSDKSHLTSPEKRNHTVTFDTSQATEDDYILNVSAYDYGQVANGTTEEYQLYIDHTAPATINGNADITYRKGDDDKYYFAVENCTDNRSGVKKGYVMARDTSNEMIKQRFDMTTDVDDTGIAFMEVSDLWIPYESPNWVFEIHAVDKAGNDGILRTVSINEFTTEFTLTASIRRHWTPTEEKFKTAFNRGELGYVDFTVTGNAERVKFEFPENLNVPNNIDDDDVRMNGTFVIDVPAAVYNSTEKGTSYKFRVPRYLNDIHPGVDDSAHYSYISDNLQEQDTPRKTYYCKVTAYRTVNGVEESVEAYAPFSIRKYAVDDYLVAVPVHPWYIDVLNIHSLDDIIDRWERKWPDECMDVHRYGGND